VGGERLAEGLDNVRQPGAVAVIRQDLRVQDPLALAEIELYGELVIAATGSDGPLSREQIDAILGVGSTEGAATARHAS
jgi:hypothetical protein